jgi:hypothetical protein
MSLSLRVCENVFRLYLGSLKKKYLLVVDIALSIGFWRSWEAQLCLWLLQVVPWVLTFKHQWHNILSWGLLVDGRAWMLYLKSLVSRFPVPPECNENSLWAGGGWFQCQTLWVKPLFLWRILALGLLLLESQESSCYWEILVISETRYGSKAVC